MEEPCKNNEDKRRDITIKLPGGASIQIRGYDIVIVVLVAAVAALVVLTIDGRDSHSRIENGIAEMIYVLSLTQEDRIALKMEMPASLRDKLNGRRQ